MLKGITVNPITTYSTGREGFLADTAVDISSFCPELKEGSKAILVYFIDNVPIVQVMEHLLSGTRCYSEFAYKHFGAADLSKKLFFRGMAEDWGITPADLTNIIFANAPVY